MYSFRLFPSLSESFRVFPTLGERMFWTFVGDLALLTWVGAQEIMESTVLLGQLSSVYLFFYLLVCLPFVGWIA